MLPLTSPEPLRPPFPWFGGKSRVADLVWQRFGNVDTYVEPFAGSLAVLLGRPTAPRHETVNDLDCYISNFWRALQHAPEAVAQHADHPVNEADLHARHRWLVDNASFRDRLRTDPEFYDAKVAGWWVWGLCLWIGTGWCDYRQGRNQKKPLTRPSMLIALSQQKPRASASTLLSKETDLSLYLSALSERLRGVRVCCGDWSRAVTPSTFTPGGVAGVFLDPPYDHDLRTLTYTEDHNVSADVRAWALASGDDPSMRIALCGYEGEHEMPDSWTCVHWTAVGGYSVDKTGRTRERVWFSPHCLPAYQGSLFG